MAMYQPKQRTNYWKVGQLITHQKIALPVTEGLAAEERMSESAASTIQSELERASADLTGCSGIYSQSQMLKLFSD